MGAGFSQHALKDKIIGTIAVAATAVSSAVLIAPALAGGMPKVGDTAAPFTLSTPDGKPVSLTETLKKGPVVLVVLRGFPGYQCPICTFQVGKLIGSAKEFAASKSQVILVYPAPASLAKDKATDFTKGSTLPKNFHFVLDPDYKFLNQYGLRWNVPNETSYPSTFVIDQTGKITYAKVSKSHGDRAEVKDILKALDMKRMAK